MTNKLYGFRYIPFVFCSLTTVVATAAGPQAASSARQKIAPVSVQQTMDLLIDPAADALWASAGTKVTAAGTNEHAPRTTAQWQKVEGYAASLVHGAKRLQTPDLPVGSNGHSRLADADTPGTRTAVQIRSDIDADPAKFRAAALLLEKVASQALTAARNRDIPTLLAAGEALDAACEKCHAAYWYPRTPPLALPTPDEFKTKILRH